MEEKNELFKHQEIDAENWSWNSLKSDLSEFSQNIYEIIIEDTWFAWLIVAIFHGEYDHVGATFV